RVRLQLHGGEQPVFYTETWQSASAISCTCLQTKSFLVQLPTAVSRIAKQQIHLEETQQVYPSALRLCRLTFCPSSAWLSSGRSFSSQPSRRLVSLFSAPRPCRRLVREVFLYSSLVLTIVIIQSARAHLQYPNAAMRMVPFISAVRSPPTHVRVV